MELNELKQIMQDNGIVGAGGAGFPSYAKLDQRADTIILNCAECEPLLKLHRQVLQKYTTEILRALDLIATTVEASQVFIAIKPSYKEAVAAVEAQLSSFPDIKISFLPEVYPAGDEVVTIYEVTGRVVAPGALPITVGVTVFNVETAYNIYRAVFEHKPVTEKFITITGEVKHPVTLRVPLGTPYSDLITMAGGATIEDPSLVGGGPMTGPLTSPMEVVTKTSNAILVLPKDQFVVQKKKAKLSIDAKRAMSACCQCHMCTDLCPRHLLGHPIQPHMIMRAVSSSNADNVQPIINAMFCSQCGLCEMFSCGQGLSPRSLIGAFKGGLRKNGIPIPKDVPVAPVSPERPFRYVNKERLTARLGLSRYDAPALLDEQAALSTATFKVKLSQHIGAPAAAAVQVGDTVTAGQVIGQAAEGKLSVNIHSPIDGKVVDVQPGFVLISK